MHNLSIHVNPAKCTGCGKCCESFSVWYDNKNGDVINSEMDRFMMLADVGNKIRKERAEGGYWLIFDIPCKEQLPDKTCRIYNDDKKRPLLCRMFPFDRRDPRCPNTQ